MKKFIVLSLAVGIMVSFGSVTFAQSPSLYLELEKTVSTGFDTSNYALDVGASSTFYVTLYAKNVSKFVSYQFFIQYNSTKIPVPISTKLVDIVIATPLESSPIYGANKILASSGSGASTVLNIAQSNNVSGFAGVDIGDTWTFLGRLEFTTDATFTTNDSTVFQVTSASLGTFVAEGADLNYISIPAGNITHAGLNTTEIPIGPPAPIIAVSPTSLDFDYVQVDSTKSLPVLVINDGDAPLNVDSVQVPADFSIDPLSSSGIAAGDTVTFTVTFAPTASGEYTSSLTFFSNDAATGSVAVNVYGTTIIAEPAPIIEVSPMSLDFDSVNVDSSKSLTVLVINTGDVPLNVDSVQVPTGFSIDPQDSSGIAAGDTVTFTVTFTPPAGGEYTDSLMFFSNDMVTGPVAVNVHGTATVTAVVSEPETVPGAYRLGPNYPNPFNPTTNIPFELKMNGRITITVYNLLGQKVAEVVNDYYTAGNHTVLFDASDLGSGIYFYRMEANGFTNTRKFVYIR